MKSIKPVFPHRFIIQFCLFFQHHTQWLHPLPLTHRVFLASEHVKVVRDGDRHLVQSLPEAMTQHPRGLRLRRRHWTCKQIPKYYPFYFFCMIFSGFFEHVWAFLNMGRPLCQVRYTSAPKIWPFPLKKSFYHTVEIHAFVLFFNATYETIC